MFSKTIKSFLISIFLILFLSQISLAQEQIPQTWGNSSWITASKWQKIPAHPRLFADTKKWVNLKKQLKIDTTSQQLFALIKERAEITLKSPSIIIGGVGVFHGEARQMQGRILTLAMTYRLTGDKRFLSGAIREMTELANTLLLIQHGMMPVAFSRWGYFGGILHW